MSDNKKPWEQLELPLTSKTQVPDDMSNAVPKTYTIYSVGGSSPWTLQPSLSQSASSNPAATSTPTLQTTVAAQAMAFAKSRRLLLGTLVTAGVWRTCSLRRHNPVQSLGPISVDFRDDLGASRVLSVHITRDAQSQATPGMSTASWGVTASCKYPDPDWPAGSVDLEMVFQYHPDNDKIELIGQSWGPTAPAHEWAEYVGFTEIYNYCKRCGVREGSTDECK